MAAIKIGDKVKYTDSAGKVRKGKIHGIRRVATDAGEQVLSYLIDTGKKHHRLKDQPEQIDIKPGEVEPV